MLDTSALPVWIAITIGITLRILVKPPKDVTRWGRVAGITTSILAGGFAGYFGHPLLVDALGWSHENADPIAAIILTLAGENIARTIVFYLGDPEKMKEIYQIWRGGKK